MRPSFPLAVSVLVVACTSRNVDFDPGPARRLADGATTADAAGGERPDAAPSGEDGGPEQDGPPPLASDALVFQDEGLTGPDAQGDGEDGGRVDAGEPPEPPLPEGALEVTLSWAGPPQSDVDVHVMPAGEVLLYGPEDADAASPQASWGDVRVDDARAPGEQERLVATDVREARYVVAAAPFVDAGGGHGALEVSVRVRCGRNALRLGPQALPAQAEGALVWYAAVVKLPECTLSRVPASRRLRSCDRFEGACPAVPEAACPASCPADCEPASGTCEDH